MCQTTTTTMHGDGDPPVDRHVLRNTQRKLKSLVDGMEFQQQDGSIFGVGRTHTFPLSQMEAVLASVGPDRLRTPSPQRKSILSRNQGYAGKENNPGTPPTHGVTTTPTSRLAGSVAGSSSLSPTKATETTPLLGSETKRENLRYTSLSELVITIPNSPFCRSASFDTGSPLPAPRTPMKDALVEKAVRAYLGPSESFNTRNRSSGWGWCLVLHQFFPSFMRKFSVAIPNPIQFFCCAMHAFSMYMTRQSMPLPSSLFRSNRTESAEVTQQGS